MLKKNIFSKIISLIIMGGEGGELHPLHWFGIEKKSCFERNSLNSFKMPAQIVTPEDLQELKIALTEIKALLKTLKGDSAKKWLKSPEVRKLLGLSSGTLQNLRVNGTLPYTKIGGVLYYDQEDIQKVMLENRKHNRK